MHGILDSNSDTPFKFCFISKYFFQFFNENPISIKIPGFDGVDGAEEDEDHVVDQGHDQGEGRHTTCLHSTEIKFLKIYMNYIIFGSKNILNKGFYEILLPVFSSFIFTKWRVV